MKRQVGWREAVTHPRNYRKCRHYLSRGEGGQRGVPPTPRPHGNSSSSTSQRTPAMALRVALRLRVYGWEGSDLHVWGVWHLPCSQARRVGARVR